MINLIAGDSSQHVAQRRSRKILKPRGSWRPLNGTRSDDPHDRHSLRPVLVAFSLLIAGQGIDRPLLSSPTAIMGRQIAVAVQAAVVGGVPTIRAVNVLVVTKSFGFRVSDAICAFSTSVLMGLTITSLPPASSHFLTSSNLTALEISTMGIITFPVLRSHCKHHRQRHTDASERRPVTIRRACGPTGPRLRAHASPSRG